MRRSCARRHLGARNALMAAGSTSVSAERAIGAIDRAAVDAAQAEINEPAAIYEQRRSARLDAWPSHRG
jgi:hypothetical protein